SSVIGTELESEPAGERSWPQLNDRVTAPPIAPSATSPQTLRPCIGQASLPSLILWPPFIHRYAEMDQGEPSAGREMRNSTSDACTYDPKTNRGERKETQRRKHACP